MIISDDENSLLFLSQHGEAGSLPTEQQEAVDAWKKRKKAQKYKELQMPVKWVEGPDRIRATVCGETRTSAGYFLNVVPEDNAIEVDRFALVNLKSPVSFYDGEMSKGALFNRVIGLFRVAGFERKLRGKAFRPDKVFPDGQEDKDFRDTQEEEVKWHILKSLIQNYLKQLCKNSLRRQKQVEKYDKSSDEYKYDLCPITRRLIGKYFRWSKEQQDITEAFKDREKPLARTSAKQYDIFICCDSSDFSAARFLYEFLKERHGERVFFSAESLPRVGAMDYCAAIDAALDSAKIMIVFGTNAECFHGGWVSWEWNSFLNEVKSGRKSRGGLISFAHGVESADMPYGLRNWQMIRYSPSSPQDSFAELDRYIESALEKMKSRNEKMKSP